MLKLSDQVEGYMINIHTQNFFLQRIKFEDFIDKTNYLLGSLPINPSAIFATWLQKILKNSINYLFQTLNYSHFI